MPQSYCNGDATTVSVPKTFADLTGACSGTQLPGGTPTGTGSVVMSNGPTLVAPVLGTPASGNLANCTFPTLNQNTSGSAASCTGNAATATTASACSGNSATATVASGLTGTPAITVGVVSAQRFNAHGGTALASGNIALSSGWGTSPTLTINRGTDQGASVQITAKATVAANPTVTVTFANGTWTTAPVVVACRTDTTAATGAPSASVSNQWAVTSVTATAVTLTFNGTPVANSSYGLSFICMGT